MFEFVTVYLNFMLFLGNFYFN